MNDTDKSELRKQIKLLLVQFDGYDDLDDYRSLNRDSDYIEEAGRVDAIQVLITQQCNQAKREAFLIGLQTGAMPEAIGKPIAKDYLAKLAQAKETEGA